MKNFKMVIFVSPLILNKNNYNNLVEYNNILHMKSLVKNEINSFPRIITLSGLAGGGKTTLCRKILRDWVESLKPNGKIIKRVELVIN